jgi:catechol 2,3-dioxygenase-like lactoylglutathione lyase family enzyme
MDARVKGKFDVGGVLLAQPFKIRRLGHFGLNVPDPAACLDFYCEGLGFRISDPLDIAENHPQRDELKKLGDTNMYFLRHGTDHHSIVLANGTTYNAAGRGGDTPADVTVNQMTWQVASLAEVSNAVDWFNAKGVRISRVGRDMPGSNWHSYPFDVEGHINEIYYGMEQIGWNLRSKPKAMYERGFRTRPELPQIPEYQEIQDSEARGVDLESGMRIVERRPAKYDVDGILLARPFKITKLGPVRLWVKDMDREVDFYTRLFGLRVTEAVTWQGHRCVFLRANGEHHSLALYPEALRPSLGLSDKTSCFSVGFRLANYRQLRDAVAFLEAEGVTLRRLPPELFPGMDYTAFAIDPQGHAVQLYAYMEQIGWDGKPRPSRLRRKVKEGAPWPECLEPLSDDNDGEVFQGPLG